jgi:hypothetical protein
MSIIASFPSRFDSNAMYRVRLVLPFDSVMNDRNAMFCVRFDIDCKYQDGFDIRFDSWTHGCQMSMNALFDATPCLRDIVSGRYDTLRDFSEQAACVPVRFDSPVMGRTVTVARFDAYRLVPQFFYNRFDAYVKMLETGISGRFDCRATTRTRATNRFHAIPQEWKAQTAGRFDAFDLLIAAVPSSRQAFVQAGWRILIRNTETDEQRDLGFIAFDAVDKSIRDVDLPDGDYEITLLYASLFWKDAIDRVVRNVTIRSGEEPVLGLPPVLNLTSEVNDGITTISWSSHTGDYENCEFGLWFAETPPVVTFREPDQRVTYTAFNADYSVKITQVMPLWCVVMAVKGNMRGPASEIYLTWSHDLPRRPDDQIAFDVYLDENLPQRKTDASGISESVGWDTSAGFW